MVKSKAADPPRVGGLRNGGAEKQRLKPFKEQLPAKICFEALGKLGPPKPKAKEECFRLAGKNKGGKDIKAQARLRAGGTQSSPQAMSAGELKENKKPLF